MKKISAFLSEVWREVHPVKGRVVWPTNDKVIKSTRVVVVMSFIVALFVGASDWAFGSLITRVLF
jgi:preprotein translocase SecE subunit